MRKGKTIKSLIPRSRRDKKRKMEIEMTRK